MSELRVIKSEDFEQEVNEQPGTVLVDFFAEWCAPCKMVSPILEKLSSEKEDIKVVKVDADEAQDLMAKFGIRGIPTLLLFKDGKLAASKVGAVSVTQLNEFVA